MKRAAAIGLLAAAVIGPQLLRRRRRPGAPTPPGDTPDPPEPSEEPLEPWEQDTAEVETISDEVIEAPPEGLRIEGGAPSELCPAMEGFAGAEDAAYCVVDPFGDPRFAPREQYAPLAPINPLATWPLETSNQRRLVTSYWSEDGTLRGSWGRQFGAKRAGKDGVQWHAGVDLFANPGDAVVAPESGTVLAILPFYHGSWAVYLLTADRRVINLGEIEKLSWREFGVKPGQAVERGQPVARTGKMKGGSTMLHVEIYDSRLREPAEMIMGIRKGKMRWFDKEAPPAELMDPSAYLLQSAVTTYRREKAGV